jgi:hypothetical protein
MKKLKTFALTISFLSMVVFASAQTADDIIQNYIKAIGGKEQVSNINSLYISGTIDAMGTIGTIKATTLNGIGARQDMDFMGSIITNCFNDKEGWSINPMMGGTTAETMPESQYKAGKNQIYIGAPFIFYAEKGYKAELLGDEAVGNVNAHKIKITSPDSISVTYFFDPATSLLLQTVQQVDMQGQQVENKTSFSDYRQIDGFTQPHKTVMDIGGQFDLTMTFDSVLINKPVDPSIFIKP